MKSIPDLPNDVIASLSADPAEFWRLVSKHIYAQELAGADDHLLVRIQQRFDFGVLVAACQGYRHYAGQRGQDADYSLEQLCRLLLVRHLNHWSLRQTYMEFKHNSLLRWFGGFLVNERTPSYVTLQRFAAWVTKHHPRLFFNEFLRQIDEDFPEDAGQAQVGDTFALLARTAPQSRTQMLRNAGRKVLFYWAQVAPVVGVGHPLPGACALNASAAALFGPPDAPREQWLSKEARDELEVCTALGADALLQQLAGPLAHGTGLRTLEAVALRQWVDILRKLLTDEFVIERGATAGGVTARPCTAKERGSFVLGSTVDPAATFRKHSEKNDLGYNVQVSATDKFIREIFASTGATPDASGVATLVANQVAQTGQAPPKLIYDRAAGSPKLFHDVATVSGGQTQLVARLIDHSQSSERFGPTDFILQEDGALICPNGQASRKFYRAGGADGYNYRFTAAQCQGCPLWQRCRGDAPVAPVAVGNPAAGASPDKAAPVAAGSPVAGAPVAKVKPPKTPKPTAYRQVFISSYRDRQRDAILYLNTPAFQLDMKFRATIERVIAALVRYNGARHANGYGLCNADFQVRMAALAYNLKRWAVLTKAKERRQRCAAPDSS
jgi:hypothetical protein